MNIKLIGITGGMQSGKDTLANAIVALEPNAIATHFARPLKSACKAIFGGEPRNYWGSDADKDEPSGWEILGEEYSTYRRILQTFGTQICRDKIHQQIWVMAMEAHLQLLEKTTTSTVAVIPDVRFPNEAEYIRSQGGIVVEVSRKDGKTASGTKAGHVSEYRLPPELVDKRLSLGLEDMEHAARELLKA